MGMIGALTRYRGGREGAPEGPPSEPRKPQNSHSHEASIYDTDLPEGGHRSPFHFISRLRTIHLRKDRDRQDVKNGAPYLRIHGWHCEAVLPRKPCKRTSQSLHHLWRHATHRRLPQETNRSLRITNELDHFADNAKGPVDQIRE
jgi:hypothetical protein